jgi:hypothetical protein
MSFSRDVSKLICSEDANIKYTSRTSPICGKYCQFISRDIYENFYGNCIPPGYENIVPNPGSIKFSAYDYLPYDHIHKGRGWQKYKETGDYY